MDGTLLLFFDGGCGLCHRLVRFALARDRRGALRFAPLDGATARSLLPPHLREDPESLVLLDGEGLHGRSEALLRVLAALGGPWGRVGLLAGRVPRRVLDGLYRLVARHRKRLFPGADPSCPWIPAELRHRFLP